MELQSPKMEEEEERRRKKKWPLMKAAQLLEFQMQALVYRYIEAGLRVPHHLVMPIWNSHNNSHSFSLLSEKGLNHIDTVVEPEHTRCRRTDGKKWRCSNRVLLFQKYCERHMHRGRKRSRKLVESSFEVASSSSTKHNYGLDKIQSVSSNAQVVTIASLPSARDSPLVISESTNESVRSRTYHDFIKQRESSTCVQVVHVQGQESLPCVQKFFPEVSDISVEAATFSSIRKNDIIERSRVWKNMYLNGGLFPGGIHFSPDTVLQDRGGIRSDNEPGRCRRTDGKKWRCSKEVMFGQKYCGKHMHRGIKKKHNSHEIAGFSSFTAAKSVSCKDEDGEKNSVSVLGMQQVRVSDEKSISSYSTDTTITDTTLRGEEDNEEELSLCSSGV